MTRTRKKAGNKDPYYDLNDDWSLIVASFQSEYGIRLSRDLQGMKWREFCDLISGLSAKSPLGRIASIRAETDADTLKTFTAEERRIRDEYRRKQAKRKSNKEIKNALDDLKNAFLNMA